MASGFVLRSSFVASTNSGRMVEGILSCFADSADLFAEFLRLGCSDSFDREQLFHGPGPLLSQKLQSGISEDAEGRLPQLAGFGSPPLPELFFHLLLGGGKRAIDFRFLFSDFPFF